MANDDLTWGSVSPSPWADLPPELVAIVLRRLPTLADRVRLRAVCRAWRREPLPVPFPWLSLPDGTFLSFPDGEIHHFPSLGGDDDVFPTCGHGVFKLVQLGPSPLGPPAPRPTDSLYAAVGPSDISIFRLGPAAVAGRPKPKPTITTITITPKSERLYDAAFLDGKLYAISYKQLYIYDMADAIASCNNGNGNGKPPLIPPRTCIANLVDTRWTRHHVTIGDETFSCRDWSYLVESGGRLLRVRRLIVYPSTAPQLTMMERTGRTLWFDVFEADLNARFCCPWKRITELGGGQALFVGKHSKSVTASECGAREDCVYFVREYCREGYSVLDLDTLGDSGVFDIRDGRITPLLPETVAKPPLAGKLRGRRPACV
nr:unnamed protein product [Digitaria exilis]